MILIALSANLPSRFGEPSQTFAAALSVLESEGIRIEKASRLWLTSPVPFNDAQPWYHNAVAEIGTAMAPAALLSLMKRIETDFGRMAAERNASRVLDLDLLDYHGLQMATETLTLPHPRMCERAFVLRPLREIRPDWVHAGSGRALDDLLARLDEGQQAQPIENSCLLPLPGRAVA